MASSADLLRAALARSAPVMDLDLALFGPQLRFVRDPARNKTAVCSRRAGKTVGCSADLIESAREKPGSVSLYLTLSRKNAKRIVWGQLKTHLRDAKIHCEVNESDLAIKLANGSVIYLAGVNDRTEIENFRGLPLGRVVIDEAQALPAYIEELIDDVIEPGLMDYAGKMTLIGTPSPVPVGYFYDCTQSAKWSHHQWTVFENPYIEKKSGISAQQHLEAALARRGVTVEHPGIQREFYGRWAHDTDALVFKFNPATNFYEMVPTGEWETVIGVDLGFDDADAIAVLGFHKDRPEVHLREEWVDTKQTISALAARLETAIKKHNPLAVVMDTGGLGKKIAEEIRRRYSLPIKAAEKQRKFEFIELLNDAMRTGKFHAPRGSRFSRDVQLVEWDRAKSKNDKLVISDRYHSDIADAVLYAFRESLHWLHEPLPQLPARGSAEAEQATQDEIREAMVRRLEEKQREEQMQREDDEWL